MRVLTEIEKEEVSGGNPIAIAAIVVTCVGMFVGAAYTLGKDLAERDNARDQ